MIASAQITVSDLNDPIQQGTAPLQPAEGMLWLDTSLSPMQLKRWSGTAWEIVNDPANISVGGRNILLNSAKNFPVVYDQATITERYSNVEVTEWRCDDAMRVVGTSGTNYSVCLLINAASHGFSTKGSVTGQEYWRYITGQEYSFSMYIKNNHATNSISIYANGYNNDFTIAPGEQIRWTDTIVGDVNYTMQINIRAPGPNEEFDITFWHPMIEYGNVISSWTPAPEDTTAEIEVIEAYVDSIQTQLDGKIDTWFYAVAPSASVPPENEWSAQDKADHVDDLYYNTTTGYCYRYTVSEGVYSWSRIKDSDINAAADAASHAQDTADGKRRVFTSQPYTPYDEGDMWAGGSTGDIKVCVYSRETGDFNATDWALASKYTDDTAVTNLQIGGRNLMLNTATNFPVEFRDSTFTKTSGIKVNEWACEDGLRVAGTSGTSDVFALFNVVSHGLALSGDNYWVSKSGNNYTYSMYLKNNHATNELRVRMNAIGTGYYTIAPGATMYWTDTGAGNGTSTIQINLATTASGAGFDVTFWHPMIEYGNKPSAWVPANEDTSKEISDAAGAVQTNLDNLSIGGRNYLKAMNGVSLTPVTVNCTYSYDSDTGTYELVGNQAGSGYSQIYCNIYNRIDIPDRLVGQKMIAHVDEMTVSNSLCAPRIYVNFMDDGDNILHTDTLSPTTMQCTTTVPTGATWVRATLRMDAGSNHQNGDTLTVRGLMLEEGTHRSAWVPAEEDMRQDIEMKMQSVTADILKEAGFIRNEVKAGYVSVDSYNQLAQTLSTVATQTAENFTWAVSRTDQLQNDMQTANGEIDKQFQKINMYMTFGDDGLSIGKENNPFSLKVTNNRLVFYDNNAEVAYLSNNQLHIENAKILTTMILGNFAFEPQSNGNLSLVLNAV